MLVFVSWTVRLLTARLPGSANDIEVAGLVSLALRQPLDTVGPGDVLARADAVIVALLALAQPDLVAPFGLGSLYVMAHWTVEQCLRELADGMIVGPSPTPFLGGCLPICMQEVAVADPRGMIDQPRHETVAGLDVEAAVVILHRLA